MTGTTDLTSPQQLPTVPRPRRRAPRVAHRVLFVDGEIAAHAAALQSLRQAGLEVSWSASGCQGLVRYGLDVPDLVVLAPELPDVEVSLVVRTLREVGPVPILLGVGPHDAAAAGQALLAGARGAVRRPYDPTEILQRLSTEVPGLASRPVLSFGPLVLDPAAHSVRHDGVEIDDLPHKEFELLRLLMVNADQVVTTHQIRLALWPGQATGPSSNAIAVHATRLRSRLSAPVVLRTVRGVGYRLKLDS